MAGVLRPPQGRPVRFRRAGAAGPVLPRPRASGELDYKVAALRCVAAGAVLVVVDFMAVVLTDKAQELEHGVFVRRNSRRLRLWPCRCR